MAFSFKPSDSGFKALALSPKIAAACLAEVEKAKPIAEGLAESSRTDEKHKHYADSFIVRSDVVTITTVDGGPTKRAAGILENTSEHALAVEFGNARFPHPDHILAKTRDIVSGR